MMRILCYPVEGRGRPTSVNITSAQKLLPKIVSIDSSMQMNELLTCVNTVLTIPRLMLLMSVNVVLRILMLMSSEGEELITSVNAVLSILMLMSSVDNELITSVNAVLTMLRSYDSDALITHANTVPIMLRL